MIEIGRVALEPGQVKLLIDLQSDVERAQMKVQVAIAMLTASVPNLPRNGTVKLDEATNELVVLLPRPEAT